MKRRSVLIAVLSSMGGSLAGGTEQTAECWAGTDPNGESRWVRCSPATEPSGRRKGMLSFNLDGIGGIRVIHSGEAHEITAEEIWKTLTSDSEQQFQAP
jgi:hypothetical protein